MINLKKFALIGAAGYIARKHVEAIKHIGAELVIAHDICSNVGHIQNYSMNTMFTHSDKLFWKEAENCDTVVICTPNHMHFDAIKKAHKRGLTIICEKPMVIEQSHFDWILNNNVKIYTVMQLRNFIREIDEGVSKKLGFSTYSTSALQYPGLRFFFQYNSPRGLWYFNTWKAERKKSGGLLFNIGIHPIDLLLQLFGDPEQVVVLSITCDRALIHFDFGNDVRGDLIVSIERGSTPSRVLTINQEDFELKNDIFVNSHNRVYSDIVNGFGIRSFDCAQTFKTMFSLERTIKC